MLTSSRLPPEVDIDPQEEDEQNNEERTPVKPHCHPPIPSALRVRETLKYGRQCDDESEDDEGTAEEADLDKETPISTISDSDRSRMKWHDDNLAEECVINPEDLKP